MFLKRIELQGFKSFADKQVIEFDKPMTGIVGPNGCGKSNISDAIRWVLGEQSVKSLRGDKMSDVIFAGAENRRALNMASVTLVIDNSSHYLNSQCDEIEITRRIYNTDQEAEYLINHKNVRLKDVLDLILDSGLGKDSLSMISQGNISSFAEAKPYERRAIFEEAAGVAKYKKKKAESLARLERTKDNLDRTFDILNELEKQISPIKRAANKALIFRDKKARLEEIEIAYLVKTINDLKQEKEQLEKDRFLVESDIAVTKTSISVAENQNADLKTKQRTLDDEINALQEKLVKVIEKIHILEKRQSEIESKRQYLLKQGNPKQKAQQMLSLLYDARKEYEDREKRLNETKTEINLLNTKLEENINLLLDAYDKRNERNAVYQRLSNRLNTLDALLKDPFSNAQIGVKTIMNNRYSLNGIVGVVGQKLHAKEGYGEAISAALAGSIYHIVTKDEASARKAIDFLRQNMSGRATFLPLTVLKTRYIQEEHQIIADNFEGYLGTCNLFVECDKEFKKVNESLLANVLLCKDLKTANELATLLNYSYNIVTLDGDIVHRGGTMTGGRYKNSTSLITAQSEYNRIKNELISVEAQLELAKREANSLNIAKDDLEHTITDKRILSAQLETLRDTKLAKYEKLKSEYEALDITSEEGEIDTSLIDELNSFYKEKDDITPVLTSKRSEKNQLNDLIERNDQQIRLKRKQYDLKNDELISLSSNAATLTAKLEEALNRLSSEYQLTYEYAKDNLAQDIKETSEDEIRELRDTIKNLGNINMSAPEEYAELKERYDYMEHNYNDLIASRDKLLKAIEEMDETMKTKFKETFDEINKALPETFTALFGGGKARLILEDPNDLLNSGIDVDVQPPGKAVKSIKLFSGGEKTLIAICVLFTIMKVRKVPLILFDEVEAALDEVNVERFAKYIKKFSTQSQFIIITHRPGTMEECDVLYGVTMQKRGVSQMMKVRLTDAYNYSNKEGSYGVS